MKRCARRNRPGAIVRTSAAILALLATTAACTVESAPPSRVVIINPTNPQATLTLHWSITSSTDPNECVKSVVDHIEISIFDLSGREVGVFTQPCTAFAASIGLDSGSYTGNAILLDGAGNPRTTNVVLAPLTLQPSDELVVTVDFPSDSFR